MGTEDDNDEFCFDDDSTHSNNKQKKKQLSSSNHNFMTNSSRYEFEVESDFKIEKYQPVTITVPKPHKWAVSTDTIGVRFRAVKTMCGDVLNDVEEDADEDDFGCNVGASGASRTTYWVSVTKIDDDSLFANTPLKVGDKIISINDTDLRESVNNMGESHHFVDTRKAYDACLQAKEFITMVVLKQDESYFDKSFCFDNSVTNLDWKY